MPHITEGKVSYEPYSEIRFFWSLFLLPVIAIGFALIFYVNGWIALSIVCLVLAGIIPIMGYIRHTRYRCPSCENLIDSRWDICPYCGAHLKSNKPTDD